MTFEEHNKKAKITRANNVMKKLIDDSKELEELKASLKDNYNYVVITLVDDYGDTNLKTHILKPNELYYIEKLIAIDDVEVLEVYKCNRLEKLEEKDYTTPPCEILKKAKPCGFCGSKDLYFTHNGVRYGHGDCGFSGGRIVCGSCGASKGNLSNMGFELEKEDKIELVENWNGSRITT